MSVAELLRSTLPVGQRLPLGDKLQLEAAGPVARDRNRDVAILGQIVFELVPLRLLPLPRPAGSPFS